MKDRELMHVLMRSFPALRAHAKIIENENGQIHSASTIKIDVSEKQPSPFIQSDKSPGQYKISFDLESKIILLNKEGGVIGLLPPDTNREHN